MSKLDCRIEDVRRLEDIPNVGVSIAEDLRRLGIREPRDLRKQDPYQLYDELCQRTRQRHDPCLLDVFISAVRFMNGEKAKPWWKYTAERKKTLASSARTACQPVLLRRDAAV